MPKFNHHRQAELTRDPMHSFHFLNPIDSYTYEQLHAVDACKGESGHCQVRNSGSPALTVTSVSSGGSMGGRAQVGFDSERYTQTMRTSMRLSGASATRTSRTSKSHVPRVSTRSKHPRISMRASIHVGEFQDVAMEESLGFEFEGLRYFWALCVGCAGLLDIGACILPSFLMSFTSGDAEAIGDSYVGAKDTFPDYILDFVRFLGRHDTAISFIFSALWFSDAFLGAQARLQTILAKDERVNFLAKSDDTPKKWWKRASFVYYRTIVIQLLLLPVGFYFLSFYAVQHVFQGREIVNLDDVEESVTVAVVNEDHEIEYETFSTTSRISVIFAILHNVFLKLTGTTERAIQSQLSSIIRKLGPAAVKSVLGRAIRNPLKFRRTVKKSLTVVRWIKYLAPLIGTSNKLKGNVEDMVKKRRQRRVSEKQKRVRQFLWEKRPVQMREEEAARMIQSAFRAYKSRKAVKALMALRGDKEYIAIMKVQRAFRATLARVRTRMKKKKEELKHLLDIRMQKDQELSDEEKRRFYQLQDELAYEAHELINRRLLMRPNTRFSVVWKILFICSVTIEIAQLAAKPWFDNYKNNRNEEAATMAAFIAESLTPTRVSQLPVCGYVPESNVLPLPFGPKRKAHKEELDADTLPWYCKEPISTVQEIFSDSFTLLLVPLPVSQWPECQDQKRRPWQRKLDEPKRWYCHKPYSSIHDSYQQVLDFLFHEFLILVGIVCFLDVFITFFTGELDESSGGLVPKPFFARWISPGLILQLLVNPALGTFSNIVLTVWEETVKIGPIRVLRWTATVIFPVIYFLWVQVINHIWIPLCYYENEFETMVNGLL